MDRIDSHIQAIKEHLLSGKELTKIDALKKYGCWNTGDVVYKLRMQGLPIETMMIQEGRKRYAVYKLQKSAKQLLLF